MNATTILEWKFSPPDFFPEPIEPEPLKISGQDYTMAIENGAARAEIDSAIYDTNPDEIREGLHRALNARFLAAQLRNHRRYELSGSTVIMHPDGRRDTLVELESMNIKLTGGTVDFLVTNKLGEVIADSKRDRIEKEKRSAAMIDAHQGDDTLASMLRGKQRAVEHPDHELVRLYEIRDALSERFHRNLNAIKTAIGITDDQWDRFRDLCNNEPLNQGRHGGTASGPLRDASQSELDEARGIASAMIEGYLSYLEANP
jgi:hypothetical protein